MDILCRINWGFGKNLVCLEWGAGSNPKVMEGADEAVLLVYQHKFREFENEENTFFFLKRDTAVGFLTYI